MSWKVICTEVSIELKLIMSNNQYLSVLLMSITYDEPALNLSPALKIIRKQLELVKHITVCASGKYFFYNRDDYPLPAFISIYIVKL